MFTNVNVYLGDSVSDTVLHRRPQNAPFITLIVAYMYKHRHQWRSTLLVLGSLMRNNAIYSPNCMS